MFVVIGLGCSVFFLAGSLWGGRDPSPGLMAKLFAPAPLDVYGDISLASGNRLLLLLLWPLRVAMVTATLGLLVGSGWKLRSFLKVGALYLGATASALITLVVALAYVSQKQAVLLGSGSTRALPILLGLELALHLGLTVLLAPMVVQAAGSYRVRPLLHDGKIWLLAIASTWIWLFIPQRIDAMGSTGGSLAFALAFVILAIQSLLLGAIGERVKANSISENKSAI